MKMLFIDGKLVTKNLIKGQRVYGEKVIERNGEEYRIWNPYRSKLAAAIYKGLKEIPIEEDSKILYLGAASGTTASHISDIVVKGVIYCIEFSPRVFKDLLNVCEQRRNMIPILRDASKPWEYIDIVEECDVVYEDIAQPNQVEILIENSKFFLKDGGYAMIAIKARSIDATKPPSEIFEKEIKKMEKHFEIVKKVRLEPYEKDHLFILAKKLS